MGLLRKLRRWLGLDREFIAWETSLAELERKAARRCELWDEWHDQYRLWCKAKKNKKKHSHFKERMEAINAELAALDTSTE